MGRGKRNKMMQPPKCLMVQDILHAINSQNSHGPPLSTPILMMKYGVDLQVRITNVLNTYSSISALSYPQYKFNLFNRLWNCEYLLKWPEPIQILGVGMYKESANLDAQLGIMAWLDWKLAQASQSSFEARLLQPLLLPQQIQSPNTQLLQPKAQHQNHIQKRSLQTQETKIADPSNIPYQENDKKYKEIIKLFPQPKNTLHNIYDLVSNELKKRELKVLPKYEMVKLGTAESHWKCWYKTKWPEELKFTASGKTKQEASSKAALVALTWLYDKQQINKEGQPVILQKDQIKHLQRESIPILALKTNEATHLKTIYESYKTKFVPLLAKELEKNMEEADEEGKDPEEIFMDPVHHQIFVGLKRYLATEKTKLPISDYKHQFVELLENNNVVILKGEPGCGKSTRIPQYVLEDWAKTSASQGKPCRIAVTQPRRIAAISLAERVSKERSEELGSIVGYHVRLKNNFSHKYGRILYCTTGILLRHLQSDPNLNNFTHVILDEAHERDVNTDLLMNLMRKVIKTNLNLKVIVMSATIDTKMFQDYFEGAPVLEIPGFTYPVTEHFLDNCKLDVSKTLKMCNSSEPMVVPEDVAKILHYIHKQKEEGAILVFLPGWDDITRVEKLIPNDPGVVVYCLHSRLQDDEQHRVFSRPPPGIRKIILATNIAETSVTIDDVVYVVDTGIYKMNFFDNDKGVTCIDRGWISQASAIQRRGRAGRVKPGECFHMYTKQKFDSFDKYSTPEILRMSLTKITLDAKALGNNVNAAQFMSELPSPPDPKVVTTAVEELRELDLIDDSENLTSLGKTLANFQLEPKFAKAMINSVVYKCVTPIVDIVTLFSADTEVFSSGLIDKESTNKIKKKFCDSSDHLALMRIFEKYLEFSESGDEYLVRKFCQQVDLLNHRLYTMEKLRSIHLDYVYNGLYDVVQDVDSYSDNDELVKAVLYSGIGTLLKHRNWDLVKNRVKNHVNVLLTRHNHKATLTPDSVNYKRPKYPSNYLLYMNETRSNVRRTTLIRESSLVKDLAVLLFSNKDIETKNIAPDYQTNKLEATEQVILFIPGTNIDFICSKSDAELLLNCKSALNSTYQYYIDQLTKFGEPNPEINQYWDNVLSTLNKLLVS